MKKAVTVAVLGAGTVGSEVIRLLTEQKEELSARIGASLELVCVARRNGEPVGDLQPSCDPVAAAANADVVVELMGGIEPARTAVLAALASGAGVVTANKALLAAHGPELYEAAQANGSDLYFEAAVAGAIPIIRPIRESLAGDEIVQFMGIVNGTTNFILDQMTTAGMDFATALAVAGERGYAEADPSADIDGQDAAAKVAILASLAFRTRVHVQDVVAAGIREITPADITAAARIGHVIKLLAAGQVVNNEMRLTVRPTLIAKDHPLASVSGAFNAVYLQAAAAGELMFYGHGAGGTATAAAVMGDIVSVARHKIFGGGGPQELAPRIIPMASSETAITRAALRLRVADQPGVLAQVAVVHGAAGVSIATVQQFPPRDGVTTGADVLITTHDTSEASLERVVSGLADLPVVLQVASVLHIHS